MKIDNFDAGHTRKNSDPKAPAKKPATGPRTEAGKHRSARNATRHGVFANSIIEGESRAAYRALVRALLSDLGIMGATGEILVEKLAITFWRLGRQYRVEVGEIRRSVQLKQRFLKEVLCDLSALGPKSQTDLSSTEPLQGASHEAPHISVDQLVHFANYESHLGREIDRIFDQLERIRRFKKLVPARSRCKKPSSRRN